MKAIETATCHKFLLGMSDKSWTNAFSSGPAAYCCFLYL